MRVEVGGLGEVADFEDLLAVAAFDGSLGFFAAGGETAQGKGEHENAGGERATVAWHHAEKDGPASVGCKREMICMVGCGLRVVG